MGRLSLDKVSVDSTTIKAKKGSSWDMMDTGVERGLKCTWP
jgi:hypothetical protein